MKANSTEIAMVVDRSGSMLGKLHATIDGFNGFVEAQRQQPGAVSFSLVLFNTETQWSAQRLPIAEIVPLTIERYLPGGGTALLDAIGETIDWLGQRLAALDEGERPGKVIVAVLTDGLENASVRFKHKQIAEMIKHQTEVYKWEFIFFGTELAAIEEAQALNFRDHNTRRYDNSREGTQVAFASINDMVTNVRNDQEPAP